MKSNFVKITSNFRLSVNRNFVTEHEPFEKLRLKYPRCESALRWWCNEWGADSRMNIRRRRWLREFMSEKPPDFPISDRCCEGAKKATAKQAEKEIRPNLTVTGVRKSEGGARASAYRSCFDENCGKPDRYRPLFWFRDSDRDAYDRAFGVTHSDCYSVYGLTRTGCACCPFGRNFEARNWKPRKSTSRSCTRRRSTYLATPTRTREPTANTPAQGTRNGAEARSGAAVSSIGKLGIDNGKGMELA